VAGWPGPRGRRSRALSCCASTTARGAPAYRRFRCAICEPALPSGFPQKGHDLTFLSPPKTLAEILNRGGWISRGASGHDSFEFPWERNRVELYADVLLAVRAACARSTGCLLSATQRRPSIAVGYRRAFSTATSPRRRGCPQARARIFAHLLRHGRRPPHRDAAVGDDPLATWRRDAAGMKAIWLNRTHEPGPSSSPACAHRNDACGPFGSTRSAGAHA